MSAMYNYGPHVKTHKLTVEAQMSDKMEELGSRTQYLPSPADT